MKHLLVTNDFPPKIGGIQSYLWELWQRLPADEAAVLTTPYEGDRRFDEAAPIEIRRIAQPVMAPISSLAREIEAVAKDVGADLVVLDPALPVGHLGPSLSLPYGVILHGAEVTIPGRVPGARQALARVLDKAKIVIAAGGYPAAEGERAVGHGLPVVNVPPGVDTDRFVPLSAEEKTQTRQRWGVSPESVLLCSVSRLVPRKGMDVLIKAAARLGPIHPELEVLIGGKGRDSDRLERLIRELGAPVRLVGRVSDEELPAFYGAADIFSMGCRNRWFGLEQEGFGIVFLEAAACAVPQIAGRSGGAHEAVEDEVSGLVVQDPSSVSQTADAIRRLLVDENLRSQMGLQARRRVEAEFSYDLLAGRLRSALQDTMAKL